MINARPLVVRVAAYPHRAAETVAWERAELEARGYTYRFVDADGAANALDELRAADAVVTGCGGFDAAVIAELAACRVLVSCSVGLDWIDVQAATRRGIAVCHLPDVCTDEVADHTLALLLACVRKVPRLDARVKGGTWDRTLLEPMPRLRGLRLGLVGAGRIGRAVADRARAFGMDVVAYDPVVAASALAAAGIEAAATLVDLCRSSDVVSIHVPLGPATRHLVGEPELRSMKASAYLVNTSRGAVVDEAALVGALREGRIRGAALDVLEREPPPAGHPLLGLPTVILTPHAAGFSDEVVDAIPRLAVEAVVAVLAGGEPPARSWANRDALVAGRGAVQAR